ncbi:hypothetical protein [Streptomyces sp. NPDC005573]|uniref:hypothetical protein n=1 Tax=Streptomyces sp. NPDC005573 TaxID=3156890 RepID=UPI0033A377C4
MTQTTTPAAASAVPVDAPAHRWAAFSGSPAGWAGLWLAATAGALLIAVSYSMSATDAADTAHYAVFWLGMLVMFVPTAAVAVSRHTAAGTRYTWMLAYALFTYLPKLLRNPGKPLFHDEIAHWRQSADLASSGRLFQPNPMIHIVSEFPGLHILTATIKQSTGLTTWQSGLCVMIVAHVLAVCGAYALGEAVLGSARAGAVVALVYSLNSSFLYFDTEFAYESLAMPMFLWCLACLARAQRADRWKERSAWGAGAVLAGIGVVPTHHLTTVVLAVLLVLIAAVTMAGTAVGGSSRATAAVTALVAATVVGSAAGWLVLAAPETFAYLSPYLGGGTSQLLHMFSDKDGSRTLFHASTEPLYEKAAAFSVPPLAFVMAVVALRAWRREPLAERRARPMRRALMLFGLLYFPSLPFILVQFGAEGARRTWGFTYIGVAVLVTPVILTAVDRIRLIHGRAGVAAGVAAALVGCDALMGNVAAGLDTDYRFPGPFVFGSDTRSVTAELVGTSHWFRDTIGRRERVVTDRYTGLILVRDADSLPAAPSKGFQTYDLYFDSTPPSAYLVHELSSSHYTYFVVDKRMATQLPAIGVFFEPDEPFAHGSSNPISARNLVRYDHLPWTTKVYDSDSYAVYRFDFDAIHDTVPEEAR